MIPFQKRAAIVWDADSVPSDSCYWDPTWLDPLLQDDSTIATSSTGSCKSISYETLISMASLVVSNVRQELTMQQQQARIEKRQEKNQTIVSMPVVVAIPEGPLLPLAILVVHALNRIPLVRRPDENNGNNGGAAFCSAILVPLEPSEPRTRNMHILRDISPALILATPGKDMETIQNMIDSISFPGEIPSLLDFSQLVQSAMEQRCESKQMKNIEAHLSDSTSIEQDIGTLIASCADRLAFDGGGDRNERPTQPPAESIISHIVYTSGTTGIPKGCISSINSLRHYIRCKNQAHSIGEDATVLLSSALSFDPCLSDCLATFQARAALAIAPRSALLSALPHVLHKLCVTHVLCTPTLWSLMAEYRPQNVPHLRVVALGGEPIPKRLQQAWSRKEGTDKDPRCRLFATYGVTEACVYQTCGEMVLSSVPGKGQFVGWPFPGLGIRICREELQDSLVDVGPEEEGEIVLYGSQLDELSGYLNRPELDYKFVSTSETSIQHYRTGDRGTYDTTKGLFVAGRIVGEDAMVKVNGVRVELGEIESALIDDDYDDGGQGSFVVLNCMAKAVAVSSEGNGNEIRAYCVLSDAARREVGISNENNSGTFVVNDGPLFILLQARCADKVKKACMPRVFVIIPRLPLSPTGKQDRNGLPTLESCTQLASTDPTSSPLGEYGVSGSKVAEVLIECLNLQPSQESILTTTATFAMVGGDSMAAVRVTRALYAYHHNVDNNRFLGGEFGKLTGPFDVVNLLRCENLGAYVRMLDSQNLCRPMGQKTHGDEPDKVAEGSHKSANPSTASHSENDRDSLISSKALYEALFQATTLGQSSIAIGLLSIGADPNYDSHTGRLGKVKHRLKQRAQFRSSPLHIACLQGDADLTKKLLEKKAKYNSPDASGYFPIHLASSGTTTKSDNDIPSDRSDNDAIVEDRKRIACVEYLLQAGASLAMRDGNKQSVLHCAARSGHCELLKYIGNSWIEMHGDGDKKSAKHFFNWRDHWMRTAVHWAVLNGHVGALEILLELGCSATPVKPKVNKSSSAAVESPMEMCKRLYDVSTEGKGAEIQRLLVSYSSRNLQAKKQKR